MSALRPRGLRFAKAERRAAGRCAGDAGISAEPQWWDAVEDCANCGTAPQLTSHAPKPDPMRYTEIRCHSCGMACDAPNFETAHRIWKELNEAAAAAVKRDRMKKDHKIQISHRKVADLLPSAKNARLHSDAQLEQVAKSIREFGFVSAILVDGENNIIAGHGRVLAARKLGMKDIPCIDVSHLTETQRQALAIADNKIPLNAAWDMHMLQIELQDLQQKGFDLDLLAFSGDELSEIFGEETAAGQTADDAAAVVKGPPVSKPGDLWILGEHRLLCGSATEPAHVKRLMDGELAACVFTDPPYGISYNSADCKGGKGVRSDRERRSPRRQANQILNAGVS